MVVACEKVIFDQTGPFSLISVFQRLHIQLQEAPLPDKAISPLRWHVFCLWEMERKEIGQTFTQIVRVYNTDGSLFFEGEGEFPSNEIDWSQVRINLRFGGVPIWAEGEIVVRVWLKGNETPVGEYKFAIKYIPKTDHLRTMQSVSEG